MYGTLNHFQDRVEPRKTWNQQRKGCELFPPWAWFQVVGCIPGKVDARCFGRFFVAFGFIPIEKWLHFFLMVLGGCIHVIYLLLWFPSTTIRRNSSSPFSRRDFDRKKNRCAPPFHLRKEVGWYCWWTKILHLLGCPKCWFYSSYQDPTWCIPSGAEFSSMNRIWCDLCFCLFNIFNGLHPWICVFQWANFSSPMFKKFSVRPNGLFVSPFGWLADNIQHLQICFTH